MFHDHCGDHSVARYNRAFALGVVLNTVYVVAEAVFGVLSGSLALLADAGHNLSDVLALLLAWGAHALGRKEPTERYTYGLRSSTILAAVVNALILLVAVGGIAWEAIRRFFEPTAVAGQTVVAVALVGVVINTATALLFLTGRKHDLNIRGAFLHMAADAGVSLAVVAAGVGIYVTGWTWIDPTTSLMVAAVVLVGTWGLFRESIDLALQAVPKGINPGEVQEYLESLPGVEHVHDLHVWAMSTTETALTAHLVKSDVNNEDTLLADASSELLERFGIGHTTLQIERSADLARCRQAPPNVV